MGIYAVRGLCMFPLPECCLKPTSLKRAVDDAADHVCNEEPRKVPTIAETRNMLRLLRNKLECSGSNQQLMRCIRQLENAFLGPDANTKQVSIMQFSSEII